MLLDLVAPCARARHVGDSRVGGRRGSGYPVLFHPPPSEPDLIVSHHPALQWSSVAGRAFPCRLSGMDCPVASLAYDQGLPPASDHHLEPVRWFSSASDLEVGQLSNVVIL